MSARNRAMGALLGQVIGDALGSQLEFQSADNIRKENQERLAKEMVGSPVWNTVPGQITDDTEMAIAVLASISQHGKYIKQAAERNYHMWAESDPFDMGMTIGSALRTGEPSHSSRSNGSMMRCSPIAVWGATVSGAQTLAALRSDAGITHYDQVVKDSTALYGLAIRYAIVHGSDSQTIFDYITTLAETLNAHPVVRDYIARARLARPVDTDEGYQDGYCMVAFQHALYSLISGEDVASALTNTILSGGDTDTNAAIVGALLGSVHGSDAFPQEWIECVLNCVPNQDTSRPRPVQYHVSTLMKLAQPILDQLDDQTQ